MALPAPDTAPVQVTCPVSGETINRDDSHRFGVGFSHYTDIQGDMKRSYSQIFNTLHCASREHALTAIRQRIDDHHNVPFGTYNPSVHNPDGEHTHETCQQNVEYNKIGLLPKASLPKACAICEQDLSQANDIYIPHVDDSTRGTHYQGILQKNNPGLSVEQATYGACSMEHAQQLAHAIIDEVIEPDYQAAKGA